MSLVLSLLLRANADQATGEVRGFRGELAATNVEATKAAPKLRASEQALKGFQRAAQGAGNAMRGARSTVAGWVAGFRQVGNETEIAGGHVGNITAQFNDLFVTAAAGQAPMQIAIQQGTQLTQVFSQMGGGAAAIRGIGKAFMSMINPVSIATLGIIAGGAALAQWAFSAGDAEEETDRLADAIAALNEEATAARTSIRLFYSDAANADQLVVLDQMAAAQLRIAQLRSQLEQLGDRGRSNSDVRDPVIRALQAAEQELETLRATNLERDQAVASAERLARIQQDANQAGADYVRRLEAEQQARQAAEDTLATLREQASVNALIAQFGEDSLAVTRLRAQQEREAFVELTNSRQVSDELKAELIAAFDAAQALAGVDMSGAIGIAANEAARLSHELGISLERAVAVANARAIAERTTGVNNNGLDVLDERNPNNRRAEIFTGSVGTVSPFAASRTRTSSRSGSSGSGGGRGGVSELEREREAVTELIARYRQELDILRESDPIRQEMLRNREALKSATEAERATILELITAREAENEVIEQQRELTDFLGQTTDSVFDALTAGAGDSKAALENLLVTMVKVVAQALLLGDGPLAGLIGPSSGATTVSAPQALATGGMVIGRGSGTSDSNVILASDGEFMINAEATRRHLPLLKAINSGQEIPAYATGGLIGMNSADRLRGATTGAPNRERDLIVIENTSSTPITAQTEETNDTTGRRKTTIVMSDEVGRALTQPGGGARRALKDTFGVRKKGTTR